MITTVINSQNKTPFGKFIHTIKSTSVLDWLNFLIVDVKDALGLFLVMYLPGQWDHYDDWWHGYGSGMGTHRSAYRLEFIQAWPYCQCVNRFLTVLDSDA